ncbi:MAG TPA: collagen-like protein [Chryseolinea sp.]|nr:collagen-like protein [Chryseolinea sp.]
MKHITTKLLVFLMALTVAFVSCEGPEGQVGQQGDKGDKGDQGNPGADGENYPTDVVLQDYSTTPALVKKLSGFESLEVFSLISSEDKLIGAPSFTFGGSADGSGLLKATDGYMLLVNHEDNFAVSRITLDKTFKPVGGEYILNSDGGQWRLCSATLATMEEHGFGPLYITCGESSVESRTHALSPFAGAGSASMSREIAGFGRWNAENAVPLPKTAYAGKTVVLIGDDDSGGTAGGQVAMYMSDEVGDLDNGKLYVLRRTDLNEREMDFEEDATATNVEFVEIEDHTTQTGAQINSAVAALNGIAFGRVEDIDYRKDGVGREVYFNVTGQDGNTDRTKYGRTYKLVLDAADPLKGTLQLILDGDNRTTGKAKAFQNVDNIVVTENYLYVQEDPNGYTTETHDSYIYQYDLATKALKPVFELDHHRTDDLGSKFMSTNSAFGSWEYGSMVDISDIVGIEDVFMLCVQVHTWRKPEFAGVDGGALRAAEDQGSQILIVKGLGR